MSLPTLGSVGYNGYFFSRFCRTRLTENPQSDRAGRTTKSVKYTLDVEDIVYPTVSIAEGIGDDMEELRRLLSEPCAELVYTGRGNDLQVNDPDLAIRDVAYGPKPEVLDMQPLGSDQACKIHFRVTTEIPECSGSAKYGKPMDASYEVDFRVDRGYTTRTITGYLEVAATRMNGARKPTIVADKFWETVWASLPMLPGFKRTHSHKLNADKRVMTYTITDQEQTPNYFMEGMDNWSGDQDTANEKQLSFFSFVNTLSASFTLQKGTPKITAWRRFGELVASRVPKGAIPWTLRVHDSLASQDTSFSFTWLKTASNMLKFLADCNMFDNIPKASWDAWRKGSTGGGGKSADPRGYAGLVYQPQWDAIIDLCVPNVFPPLPPQGNIGEHPFGKIKVLGLNEIAPFMGEKLSPESSWVAYQSRIEFAGMAGLARHKPLAAATSSIYSTVETHEEGTIPRSPFRQAGIPADDIQQVGSPSAYLTLSGGAVRAGYPVTPPRLLSVGGVTPLLDRPWFECGELFNNGIPVFYGSWRMVYLLPSMPTGPIPIPSSMMARAAGAVTGVLRS